VLRKSNQFIDKVKLLGALLQPSLISVMYREAIRQQTRTKRSDSKSYQAVRFDFNLKPFLVFYLMK
jgi:hypothetical protein